MTSGTLEADLAEWRAKECRHPPDQLAYRRFLVNPEYDPEGRCWQLRLYCRACGWTEGKAFRRSTVEGCELLPVIEPALQHWYREARTATRAVIFLRHLGGEPGIDGGLYALYLQSHQWRVKRAEVIARAGGVCEECHVAPATQAHHKTYERLYEEPLADLVALCRQCHQKVHGL